MAQEAFPLHFLVWNNQYLELDRELQKKEVSEEGLFRSCWRVMCFTDAFVRSHCIALMLPVCVLVPAAGCGAPGSERAHPAGAGCVSGPPGVHPGAAQTHRRPDTQQRAGLDQ